jgi:hypothetical protein
MRIFLIFILIIFYNVCYSQLSPDVYTNTSPSNINKLSVLSPIELIEFNGECINDLTNLTWIVASEGNSQSFIIERSKNTEDWIIIAEIPNTNNNVYNYTDIKTNDKNIYYYRLSQKDFSGKITFFDPMYITCNNIRQNVTYYPNPFTNEINFNFDNIQNIVSIIIRDVSGRVYIQEIIDVNYIDNNSYKLSTSRLALDVYYLEIASKGFNKIARIIKTNNKFE